MTSSFLFSRTNKNNADFKMEETMNFFRRLFGGNKQRFEPKKGSPILLKKEGDNHGGGDDDDDDDDEEDSKYVYSDRKEEMRILDAKFGSDAVHHYPNLKVKLAMTDDKIDYLGHGAFSVVKKCFSRKYDRNVAVKVILLNDENNNSYIEKFLPKEIDLWGELSKGASPHILNMIDSFVCKNYFYIIMDVADNGDLSQLLMFGPMTEHKARSVFLGILAAVTYCHEKGIAHRDIKPENLLLTKQDRIKLADFSFVTRDNPVSCERCGTPGFLAPEQRDCGYYDPFMSDMWQIGLTLYYMLFKASPFTSTRKKHLLLELASCKHKYRNVPMPPNRMLSKNGKEVLAGLLQMEVPRRWTIKQANECYWLNPLGPDRREVKAS